MRQPRTLVASIFLIALAVVAAGCSGGSDAGGSDGSDGRSGGSGARTTVTSADSVTGPFCDQATEMYGLIEKMIDASRPDRSQAETLAESKRFFGQLDDSLQELAQDPPPEIEDDVTYIADLFHRQNARVQDATTLTAYTKVASETFGATDPEYARHNAALDTYFRDVCRIGAETSTTTTTAAKRTTTTTKPKN